MNFWHKLLKDRIALVSLTVILGVIFLGIFAPYIAPHDPLAVNLSHKFAPWGSEYLLGSDYLGRCVFSRLLYGIRTTIYFALLAMFITVSIGVILGVLAGFFHKAEGIILRFCDIMLSFPSELLMLAVVGMLGVGIVNVIIAHIVAKSAWYIRMIYSFSISYQKKPYILFSKTCGNSSFTIIRKHLLPVLFADIVMLATLDAGGVILSISGLSFLGLGVQPPTPEWGMMLSEAKNVMSIAPMQMLPPGFMILIVVAAFNFLGDSLRDILDPKYYASSKESV